MTSLAYFVQEKRKIQGSVNDIVEQINKLQKVNIEDAESVQVLIENIFDAGERLKEEQEKFRALVFEHYAPAPDEEEAPDSEDVDAYYGEEEQPQQQAQVEPDPAMQQQAIVQNIVNGVTALVGAYGIFKSLKK